MQVDILCLSNGPHIHESVITHCREHWLDRMANYPWDLSAMSLNFSDFLWFSSRSKHKDLSIWKPDNKEVPFFSQQAVCTYSWAVRRSFLYSSWEPVITVFRLQEETLTVTCCQHNRPCLRASCHRDYTVVITFQWVGLVFNEMSCATSHIDPVHNAVTRTNGNKLLACLTAIGETSGHEPIRCGNLKFVEQSGLVLIVDQQRLGLANDKQNWFLDLYQLNGDTVCWVLD